MISALQKQFFKLISSYFSTNTLKILNFFSVPNFGTQICRARPTFPPYDGGNGYFSVFVYVSSDASLFNMAFQLEIDPRVGTPTVGGHLLLCWIA